MIADKSHTKMVFCFCELFLCDKSDFFPNGCWHKLHWNGFLFSCTDFKCLFKVLLIPNDCWHISQWKSLLFSWTMLMWRTKIPFCPKASWQISHWNGFSFLCLELMWLCRVQVLRSTGHSLTIGIKEKNFDEYEKLRCSTRI
jgi:hypothetical protein